MAELGRFEAPDRTTVRSAEADPTQLKRILRRQTLRRSWRMREFYLLLGSAVILLILFKYRPMYGVLIAFKDFHVGKGIWSSPWNNFMWFERIFNDHFFWRAFRNTIILSLLKLAVAFPAPIILALLFNEVRNVAYKRVTQSVSYLPHFISWVVLAGILKELLSVSRGPIPFLMQELGLEVINFMTYRQTFRALLVFTGIWQGIGFGTIIYLAALSGIDPQLYESAALDGANRFQNVVHITIPSLVPVITILLLLSIGNILEQGGDQILNLYNPVVYEVSDIFDTLVLRAGIKEAKYGYATAMQLFQNTVGLVILVSANAVIRRYNEYGVW